MARLALLTALGLIGSLGSAVADPIGPAVDVTIGGGLYAGELGVEADRLAVEYRLGAGLSRGPWAVLLSVHMHQLRGLAEPRELDPVSYLGVGLEPSVRRELTVGPGLRMHVRLGYAWRWLYGDREVNRLCNVHGGCDGGFWQEKPAYDADGPVLAFGLGGRLRGDIWPSFGVELALGHHTLDRKGLDPDLRGTFVSLGLNLAVGRAR
jgi:hypothetical protein